MNAIPDWAALLAAALLILGAGITFIGSVGLVRLRKFYDRVHAPTLGTTLGTLNILLASMLYFGMSESRFVLHEILIAIFVTATTPVTLLLLVRAAVFRERQDRKGD